MQKVSKKYRIYYLRIKRGKRRKRKRRRRRRRRRRIRVKSSLRIILLQL